MNRRTGLTLLVTIAVLGGLAYYLNTNPDVANTPPPTSVVPVSESPTNLWAFDPSQMQSITVFDAAQQKTFSAVVDATGLWQVTQPIAGPADQTLMATVANTAASLSVSRTLNDVGSLADFGLTAPAYAIELKQKDGQTFKATVGQKAVTGNAYYVLAAGSTSAMLVSSGPLDTLLTLPVSPPLAPPTPVVTPTLPLTGTASP